MIERSRMDVKRKLPSPHPSTPGSGQKVEADIIVLVGVAVVFVKHRIMILLCMVIEKLFGY